MHNDSTDEGQTFQSAPKVSSECPFIIRDDSDESNTENLGDDSEAVTLPVSTAVENKTSVKSKAVSADVDSEQVAEDLLLAAHSLRGVLSDHLAKFGLNDIRYAVLKLIADSTPDGCSQAELARHLRQSESSISTLVDRMRASHLVYRLRSKKDRRKRVLMLTEQGQEMLTRARASYREQVDHFMGWTQTDEQRLFAGTLKKLVSRLENPAAQAESSAQPENVFGLKASGKSDDQAQSSAA